MKNNFQPVQITRFVLSLCCLLCFSVHLFAQQITVSGNVKDSSGEPVIGASVLVKGTTNGVITDFDGNFSIANVEDGSQIEVSYIGYVTQMKKATGTQPLNFILKEDTETLDEVIVVGYGIQKKSVVTASISRVSSDDLKNVTPTRVDNMLKGQTSGVTVTSASGQPGDAAKVRIRGIGTINNSDPLYIVDGMPVDGGIDYLNPSDIESIEVLKDAASAAVYGARAANGVVLVTTKGGSKGKAVISYDFSYGWQNPWRKRDVLNAVEYETLMNEMAVNSGKDAPYANPEAAGEGTDWQDALFNSNAPIMNHQISVSGGSDKGSYFLSTGYFKQDGIVGGNFDRSNYERFTLRMNSNYTLFDQTKNRNWLSSFKIGTNIGYTRIKSVGVDTNNEKGGPLGSALMIAPTLPVYAEDPEAVLKEYPTAIKDKNGNVYTIVGDAYNEITNPLAQLELPGDVNNSDKFVASFWGELQLWDNLKFKTTYGADLAFWGNDGWIYPYYLGKSNSQTQSSAWSGMNRGYTWQLENVLSYDKTFGQHSVSVILGQSAKKYQGRTLWGKNYNLQSLDPDKANINFGQGTKADQEATGQAQPFSTLASMFARVSYNYAERYMFQATIRRDGSSNFGPNNKYAVFPSLSLGWNITNEKFMEKRPEWLTSMKLRASWGKNGNERIDAFRYTAIMNSGNNYIFGANGNEAIVVGAKPNGLPNPDLKWEETSQTDLGLDFGFLGNALTFTVDWYKKKTDGMLMQMPLPAYVGDTPPMGNVGKMENSGIEMDLSYRFQVSDLNVKFGANASYLKNKLIELGNAEGWANYDAIQNIGTITRAENGEPFPFFYGKKTAGIFQNWDEVNSYVNSKGEKIQPNAQPGDVRFVDANGDGKIDDADRVKIGKGMPDWTVGFSIALDWRGFDLNAFFQGTIGNDVFDGSRRIDLKSINLPSYMLDRWHGEGTSNKYPRLSENDENGNWLSSDLYIKDGSYLRLKNIQLGYTLPKAVTTKFFVQNLRVYVGAENLFTITGYDGFDPEISSGGTSLGVDKGVYPQAKTFTVSANITF